MDAPKRKEIQDATELYGEVLSGGIGGVDAPAALPALGNLKGEVRPTIDGDQKSGLQTLSLPEFDEGTKKIIRTRVSYLLDDAGFRKAMTTLKGCHEKALRRAPGSKRDGLKMCERLLEVVPIFAAMAVMNGSTRRENLEKLWSVGTGKTWKALREYPRRLRELGKEVESINNSPFFSPDRSITSQTPHAVYSKVQFQRLPATLGRYADWLEAWAMRITALQRQQFHRSQRGHSPSVGYVSDLAKILTGRFCDREVSDILNAADLVLNPDKLKSGLRFAPQIIADLRSRQKKKPTQT